MEPVQLGNGVCFIELARRGGRGNKCSTGLPASVRHSLPASGAEVSETIEFTRGSSVEHLFPLPPLRANLIEQRKLTNVTRAPQPCFSSAAQRLGGKFML